MRFAEPPPPSPPVARDSAGAAVWSFGGVLLGEGVDPGPVGVLVVLVARGFGFHRGSGRRGSGRRGSGRRGGSVAPGSSGRGGGGGIVLDVLLAAAAVVAAAARNAVIGASGRCPSPWYCPSSRTLLPFQSIAARIRWRCFLLLLLLLRLLPLDPGTTTANTRDAPPSSSSSSSDAEQLAVHLGDAALYVGASVGPTEARLEEVELGPVGPVGSTVAPFEDGRREEVVVGGGGSGVGRVAHGLSTFLTNKKSALGPRRRGPARQEGAPKETGQHGFLFFGGKETS